MLEQFSQRLLTLLQFTRMALVFTAISNSLCTLLLSIRREIGPNASILSRLKPNWPLPLLVALISIGLYGFGMALNDIIDRRRDQQLAAHRPLPSGRIRLLTAHIVAGALIVMALAAGVGYARLAAPGWLSLALVIWTAFLIGFYDLAGKYLVAPGLLTLGLIRFFHAVIPAPQLPLLWHPLLLFTHVAILSAVAYAWEGKRPPLTRLHWTGVIGGVVLMDALLIGLVAFKPESNHIYDSLWLKPGLALPAGLALLFILVAWVIRMQSPTPRQAGQTVMLAGLLWLIIYDGAFAAVYVGLRYAAVLLLLLPMSYLMVHLMRWWSRLLAISQQPQFKRYRSGPELNNSR